MQLFVIGMHRSGTSLVARLLNLAGAYFGPEGSSIGANEENPKCFWERPDVVEINGKMDETNKTLNGLTVKTAVIEKGQESFDKAIEGLQQKSNRNDVFVVVGNMIVVAVASVANALGLRD